MKKMHILIISIGLISIMFVPLTSLAQLTLQNIAAARKTLAEAQRRIVCNSDPDDVVYKCQSSTPSELLSIRAANVPGTAIDTYIYCTSLGLPLMCHNTTVGEVFTDTSVPFDNNIIPDLINQGTDALEVVTNYMRTNSIEVFWSLRMNDTHDNWGILPLSQFKQNNPQYLVGSQSNPPLYSWWSALDYAHSDVRTLVFNLVQEVCYNYDIDGIELDFMRNPILFKTVANGATATQAECDLITDLLSDIRTMADTRGVARQRPILIEVHVPDSVEYCKAVGIDIEQWGDDGLIDILVTGGEFQLNNYEYNVDLATQYDIPVWPCLGAPEDPLTAKELNDYHRGSRECWRARAMNAWNAGSSAIYTFNLFPYASVIPIFNDIYSASVLTDLDKLYFCLPISNSYLDYYILANGLQYQNVPALNPYNAYEYITEGSYYTAVFPVSDDVQSEGGTATGIVYYVGDNINMEDRLELRVNGKDQGPGTASIDTLQKQLVQFSIDPALLEQGYNQFEVGLKPLKTWYNSSYYADDNPWDVIYSSDALPATPWTAYVNGGNISAIDTGRLHLVDDSSSGTAYYINSWNMSSACQTVVETRMKLISSSNDGVAISVSNGSNIEILVFESNQIKTLFGQQSYSMDTTDEFHTYKIVTKNNDIMIYVDGVLRIDGTGEFTQTSANNKIWFGSGGSSGQGESMWEYVKYAELDINYSGQLPQNPWDVNYLATALPQSPWTAYISGGNTTAIDNGALHITDNSSGTAYYQNSWNMSSAYQTVVDTRMKLISSSSDGVAVSVSNGSNIEILVFGANQIKTLFGQQTYNMDTTDAFHTYRITTKNNDIKIYVDDMLRIDGTGKFTQTSSSNQIWFGSGGSTGQGESMWEYVRYTELSLNYPEELPETPWISVITGNNTATIDNGVLHITDNSSDCAYYKNAWNMSDSDETIVEARMKLISSSSDGVAVSVSNGSNIEILVFESNQIKTLFGQQTYNMDTTHAFHNYKIVARNNDIKIYVDGILGIDGTSKFTQTSSSNQIWFGSGGSTGQGESMWEYVRYNSREKVDVNYVATGFPQEPWSANINGNNVAAISDGVLSIVDDSSYSAYYLQTWNARPDCDIVIEAKMKLISSSNDGVAISVSNGSNIEILVFESNQIKTLFGQQTYSMDTTSAFHTYKIVAKNNDIKIYVDGVLRVDGAGDFTQTSSTNQVWFGSGGSTGEGESLWEYVKTSMTASGDFTLKDLIISTDYN